MKKTTSQQARKQRKWRANAPLHKRQKMVSAPLSEEIKKKYKRNALPVRKKDTVKIMRGNMRGHTGEVVRVDLKTLKIFVHGVTAKKADGKDKERPIDPSNVQIIELSEEDKKRREVLSRKLEAK
ncbi:MAG: 50S ribosomal protein L24 [Candidatus Altiarchaeota archaeon]|nr:50S ribosomal protein L24 [Candidatus Altiarchaeota archaeon]